VFTAATQGTQLVRVALRSNPDPTRELSYRVILQEVPPEASPDFTGLRVALRLSIPLFVAPHPGKSGSRMVSHIRPERRNCRARGQQRWRARTRARLTLTPRVARTALQDTVAGYVLPGQFRTWTLQNNDKTRETASPPRRYS